MPVAPRDLSAAVPIDDRAFVATGRPDASLWRRYAPLAVKFLVSGGLIGFLLYRHAPNYQRFAHINIAYCALVVGLICVQVALNTGRWRIILNSLIHVRAGFGQLFGIYYASLFFTQILPSIGGDVVRVMYHRRLGLPVGPTIISVALDRVMGLGSLLLLILVSIPLLNGFHPSSAVMLAILTMAGGGIAGAGIASALLLWMQRRAFWHRLSPGLQSALGAFPWLMTSRASLSQLLPLSIAVHLLSLVVLYLAATAVGVPLSLLAILAAGPSLFLAQAVPVSIGGWGIREAAAVVVLGITGTDAASAVLIGLTLGVLITLAALPGVLLWLVIRD